MTTRGTAARVAHLRQELGTREIKVLRDLYRLRVLKTDQIRRLHFAENSPTTQGRRTRELLRRLHGLKLVVRLGRQVGGVRAGSRGYMFGLSGLGQAVLGQPGPFGRRRRIVWEAKPYFQDHILAVAEINVQLVEACRDQQAELLTYNAEPACWRRFSGVGGEVVILKPDAYLQVGIGEYQLSWFVEVDLGTESLPTIRRKCQLYLRYWHAGLEQQRCGVFPRVVWLVPDERRAKGIVSVLKRLTGDAAKGMFTVATIEQGPVVLTTLPSNDGGAS